MEKLGNSKKTIDIIQKYDFAFQKKYGQNFLIDPHVLAKIIDAADVNKDDYVIEIGPGIGSMTQYLCESAKHVTAVEIDKALIPILKDTLSPYDNISIINNDILKMDLKGYIEENYEGKQVKIVANLPYYITTPIVMGLLEGEIPIKSITIMVQKEVADRMKVGPGTKDYGALSLAVQYYASPKIIADVPPNCFIPRPNVGSAVIKLDVYNEKPVTVNDEKHMFKLIRAAFNQRRKTLTNAISNADTLSHSKEDIVHALSQMGLSETIRGEALNLEQFAQLSDILNKSK